MGVDDWLTKPCHTEELVARIESWLATTGAGPSRAGSSQSGGRGGNTRRPLPGLRGRAGLGLTRREFELIELLAGAGGEAVERELIYEQLWGYAMLRCDRSVDVFVHKLRRKLALASPDGTTSTPTGVSGTALTPSGRGLGGDTAGTRQRSRASARAAGGLDAQAASSATRRSCSRRSGAVNAIGSHPACPRPRRGIPPDARARHPEARTAIPNR